MKRKSPYVTRSRFSAYIGKRRLDKCRHKRKKAIAVKKQSNHKLQSEQQLINNPEKLTHPTEIQEKTDKEFEHQFKVSIISYPIAKAILNKAEESQLTLPEVEDFNYHGTDGRPIPRRSFLVPTLSAHRYTQVSFRLEPSIFLIPPLRGAPA
jgi:hypothetical protein